MAGDFAREIGRRFRGHPLRYQNRRPISRASFSTTPIVVGALSTSVAPRTGSVFSFWAISKDISRTVKLRWKGLISYAWTRTFKDRYTRNEVSINSIKSRFGNWFLEMITHLVTWIWTARGSLISFFRFFGNFSHRQSILLLLFLLSQSVKCRSCLVTFAEPGLLFNTYWKIERNANQTFLMT